MEQEKLDNDAIEGESLTNASNMLEQVIRGHGLIVVDTEKFLDARPFSLVIATSLSTGQALGEYSTPLVSGILHLEGQKGQTEMQNFLENSKLSYDQNEVHLFSFTTQNQEKEKQNEPDVFLGSSSFKVPEEIEKKGYDAVIIHNFSTVSNFFLDDSEKDSVKAIKKLQANNAAAIVFVENGTKGSALLQSMADVVFEVARANNKLDAPINITCIKYPSFEINPPKPFCLSLSVSGEEWTVTEETDPDETLDLVISLACRGKKQEDIGAFIGLQQYQVSRLLKKAENLGLITRNGHTVRRVK